MFGALKDRITEYSRRYQIDLAYAIKNEFWVYLRLGVSLLIGLGVAIAFARLAPKEVFGQYTFILAILAIISLFSIPGLNSAVLRSTARGNEGNYEKAVKTSFLWSLLGIPALLGLGAYYYYFDSPVIGFGLMVCSVFFPFVYAPNTWDSFLVGKKRFDLRARWGIIQSAINAVAIVAVLFLNAQNLVLILIAQLVSSSCVACWLYFRSLKYIENQVTDGECQKYGYFLTTTNIVGTIANNIDKILIGVLLGTQDLALYAIAIVIPVKIKDLLKSVWTPFSPKISEQEISIGEAVGKLRGLILPIAVLIVLSSLLYWLFVDEVVLWLFSAKYVEAGDYARLLLFMVLLSVPAAFLGTFSIARKKTRSLVLGYHIYPAVKLAIMAGFIYQWGIWGAVWGLNVGMLLQMLLIWAGIVSEEGPL